MTLINLFYKQALWDFYLRYQQGYQSKEVTTFDRITQTMCPLQGLKCPYGTFCDCHKICGPNYMKFKVTENESIFVLNRKLTPATYCLPIGIQKCNLKSQMGVLSLSGWSCITKNSTIFSEGNEIACKSTEAADNTLNVLWDYLDNKPAEDIEEYYERLPTGELRYRCQCNSKSINGVPMVSPVPFVCAVDYCLKDIENPAPGMGWNGSHCECTVYPHLEAKDKTSPCRTEVSEVNNNLYTGRVLCMNKNSYVKNALYCPGDNKVMYFEVPTIEKWEKYAADYVGTVIHPTSYGFKKNEDVEVYYNKTNAEPLRYPFKAYTLYTP